MLFCPPPTAVGSGPYPAGGRGSDHWYWASRGHRFWLVRGELEELFGVVARPESQYLVNKGALLVQDFEYGFHLHGREAGLKPFEETARQLHLVA